MRLFDFLDPTTTSKYLITSRQRKLLRNIKEVPLALLSETDALQILLSADDAALKSIDDATLIAARKISKACGYLPLVIA